MEADKPSMFLPAIDASCLLPPSGPRIPSAAASRTMKNRRRMNRKRRATRRN